MSLGHPLPCLANQDRSGKFGGDSGWFGGSYLDVVLEITLGFEQVLDVVLALV